MKRRTFISKGSLLFGSLTIGSGSLLSYCCQSETASHLDFIVTSPERKLINELGDIIIPKTDTPGAQAANVGDYIGLIVQDCYSKKDQKEFKTQLSDLEAECKALYQRPFLDCSIEERRDLLSQLDNSDRGFKAIKRLITSAYLSSEIGETQFFKYTPVPGEYEGCIYERPW